MRPVIPLAVLLPAVFSPLLVAAQNAAAPEERSLREECAALSQADMKSCLARKADEAQKALRQAEEKVVAALARWDEDAHYVEAATARLAASSKEYQKYRQTSCDFLASLSGGSAGNARELRRLACVAELDARRADQLSHAAGGLPLK